jgi:hypothetical protein
MKTPSGWLVAAAAAAALAATVILGAAASSTAASPAPGRKPEAAAVGLRSVSCRGPAARLSELPSGCDSCDAFELPSAQP